MAESRERLHFHCISATCAAAQNQCGNKRNQNFSCGRCCSVASLPLPSAADLPDGFVRLADVDPSIRQDMRYAGSDNFLGRPVAGYEAPVCILTAQAARGAVARAGAAGAEGHDAGRLRLLPPGPAVTDLVAWTRTRGAARPALVPARARASS